MGRLASVRLAIIAFLVLSSLAGCGGGKPKSGPRVPVTIKLSPSSGSIDIGSYSLQFTATTSTGASVTSPTFTSSNPAVLTLTATGLACGGTWNATDTVCTPGGAGVAEVTVSARGVSSPPVTVYVHQHIDRISVSAVPISSGPLPYNLPNAPQWPSGSQCYTTLTGSLTTAQAQTYQATAFSGGVDITPTVGPFNWAAVTSSLVTLAPLTVNGVANGQVQVTAKIPGMTQILASIANTNSLPTTFIGCPVESVSLALTDGGGNLIDAAKGASTSVTATVLDAAQNSLTTVPLTWTSQRPSVSAAPTGTSVDVKVAGTNIGGTAYSAACLPTSAATTSCNANFYPMLAIYPPLPIGAVYNGTSSTSSAPAYVTTTNATCASDLHCVPIVASVTSSSTAPSKVAGLGAVPNSFLFNGAGTLAYSGSPKGLITFDTSKSTATTNNTVTGQVIAVSPNGSKVVAADTQSAFKQIFVHDTGTGAQFSFPIASDASSAVAAFSQDNLKAFIAVQAPSGNQLYVYSVFAPLQTLPLGRTVTDAAFLPSGAFGFLAQPSDPANGLSYLATCDDPYAPVLGSAPAPGSIFIRPLTSSLFAAFDPLNNQGFITLSPPNIELVAAKVSGTGCGSSISVSASLVSTVPLGQGAFTPKDFIVSSDGRKAYILAANFGSVIVYDILSQTTSSIALVGNAIPLAMALTSDGATLYVSGYVPPADNPDSSVHIIDTTIGVDVKQVSVPPDTLCYESTGGQVPACLPDLLLVKP